jgi:hypothetical protein
VEEFGDGVPEDTASFPVASDGSGVDAAETDADAESAPQETSEGSKADMIVVWRPDRRPPPPNRRESERKQSTSGAPNGSDSDSRAPILPFKRTGSKKKHPELRVRATGQPTSADGPDAVHAEEKRRQRASDRGMPRSPPTTGAQHRASIDPNSPFAKLLELRSLLERQANKRP